MVRMQEPKIYNPDAMEEACLEDMMDDDQRVQVSAWGWGCVAQHGDMEEAGSKDMMDDVLVISR